VEDSYEPALETKVAAAIQAARQARQPLALGIMEIDNFSELMLKLGPADAGNLIFDLRQLLAARPEQYSPILVSDSRLAMIWENISRAEAVDLARQIMGEMQSDSAGLPNRLTLSIGVAALEFAPKNYPPRKLVEAAFGCLSAAQLSGGNAVKSIAV
jgi:GGDEF domain-containing protein